MLKLSALALVVAAVFLFTGCGDAAGTSAAPPAPKGSTKEVQSGNKAAKGFSPDSLTVPGDGKGNFGSKSSGQ